MKRISLFIINILTLILYVNIAAAQSTTLVSIIKKQHLFSDLLKPDMFILTLRGSSLLKSRLTFQIINSGKKEIFKKEFPSQDLLGDMEDVLSTKQKIDTIKSRMSHFFDDDRFAKPAIGSEEKYDEDQADINVWTTIKTDRNAIGFIYSHGYESTYRIAWAKKWKKVVEYFYSD